MNERSKALQKTPQPPNPTGGSEVDERAKGPNVMTGSVPCLFYDDCVRLLTR